MANFFILTGRLTKKPELRRTKSNTPKPVTTIRLAVERSWGDGTDFLNITVWDVHAENVCKYLDKGSMVEVKGHIQEHEQMCGNSKFVTCELVCESIWFLPSGKKREDPSDLSLPENVAAEPPLPL